MLHFKVSREGKKEKEDRKKEGIIRNGGRKKGRKKREWMKGNKELGKIQIKKDVKKEKGIFFFPFNLISVQLE